jgi:hypothetical protein
MKRLVVYYDTDEDYKVSKNANIWISIDGSPYLDPIQVNKEVIKEDVYAALLQKEKYDPVGIFSPISAEEGDVPPIDYETILPVDLRKKLLNRFYQIKDSLHDPDLNIICIRGIPPTRARRIAAMSVNANTKQLENSLNRLVSGLISKGFMFVTTETSAQQMQEQVSKFDEGRLQLTNKLTDVMFSVYGVPVIAKKITELVFVLGVDKANDTELATLHQLMQSNFPLCAISFSKIYGPRFVPIINGDSITQQDFFVIMDRFQEINLSMLALGGRLALKLLGKPFSFNVSSATGSIIFIASTTQRANVLRQWISSKPLRSDTVINELKKRVTRWQFWAKAVFGLIEYAPHQLRQEAIVLDVQIGQATSTAAPRLSFEFGFSLNEITEDLSLEVSKANIEDALQAESQVVTEEEGMVRIIIELPGVKKESIDLRVDENAVYVSTKSDKNFHKTINLDYVVDPKSAKASYVNGKLTVYINKKI